MVGGKGKSPHGTGLRGLRRQGSSGVPWATWVAGDARGKGAGYRRGAASGAATRAAGSGGFGALTSHVPPSLSGSAGGWGKSARPGRAFARSAPVLLRFFPSAAG
jgi:hypothetical protein